MSQMEPTEQATDFLMGLLERMGVAADLEVHEDDNRITIEVQTADTEAIIGRDGNVLDALQHLVNKATYRDKPLEGNKGFVLDAGGYRAKQNEKLESLAKRMAEKARDTGRIIDLQPMSAHDRRIVHMAIADIPGISTRSEGEGRRRHILIIPDGAEA